MAFAAAAPFAALGAAASIGGAVIGAMGAIQSANTQAAVANYNAQQAHEAAVAAVDRANADAERRRRDTARILGRNAANIGASGIEMTGSPLAFMVDQAGEGELNALLIEYGGKLQARGYNAQANLYRAQAKSAQEGAPLTAAGILLGGVGKAAQPYLKNA